MSVIKAKQSRHLHVYLLERHQSSSRSLRSVVTEVKDAQSKETMTARIAIHDGKHQDTRQKTGPNFEPKAYREINKAMKQSRRLLLSERLLVRIQRLLSFLG